MSGRLRVIEECCICLGYPLPDGAPPRPEHRPDEHVIDFDPQRVGPQPWVFETGGRFENLEWIAVGVEWRERDGRLVAVGGERVWQRRFWTVVEPPP